jgi:hypothetical protein
MAVSRYTTRQQTTVLRALQQERGQGWAIRLGRDEFNAVFEAALVARYGQKED